MTTIRRDEANQQQYLQYLRGRGYRGRKVIRADGRPTDTFKKFVKSIGGRLRLPQDFVYVNRATRNLVDTRTVSERWVREYRRGLRNTRFNRNVERKQAVNRRAELRSLTYHRFEDILGVVRGMVMNLNAPFQLVLTSGTTGLNDSGLNRRFNSFQHFENWFNQIQNEGQSGSDDTTSFTFDKDMWEWVAVEIRAIAGGCNKHRSTERKIKCKYNTYTVFSPVSMLNNCGMKCVDHLLGVKINCKDVRKHFRLETNTPISYTDLTKIYNRYRSEGDKPLCIIDEDMNEELDHENCSYILLNKNHYYCILSSKKNHVKNRICRGSISWDFETRPTAEYVMIGDTKSYILKPTIVNVWFNKIQKGSAAMSFVTEMDGETVIEWCGRKFLNWLIKEHEEGRAYNCIAHNGARFDHYLLMNDMTEDEVRQTKFSLRGHSIIGIKFGITKNRQSHFKDPCCFMPCRLAKLSESFKIADSKMTSFELHGETITNEQLCFYRPELSFGQFMNLQNTDKEFWKLYTDYCTRDCVSLAQIWKKFVDETNNLIEKMRKGLCAKCPVQGSNTIGSLAIKIVRELNKDRNSGRETSDFKRYKQFIGGSQVKYKFVSGTKRGGISDSGQMGKHEHSIVSYDICSEYPTACIKMIIPVGESRWTDTFDASLYGYYNIGNMKWSSIAKKFKPIASSGDNRVLNWHADIKEVHTDSEMIKYLMEHCGLLSFDVMEWECKVDGEIVKKPGGLVSDKYMDAGRLFGTYVNVLGEEKCRQDALKKVDDPEYNPAYREVIKLFLNSLTGKLVEDTSKYFKLKYTSEKSNISLGGVNVEKEFDGETNVWMNAGVMVYSYSKRLMFEYARCLSGGSDDIIVMETDSMYFDKRLEAEFIENVKNYDGEYPVDIGDKFGNVKKEIETVGTSYTLGKKMSYFGVGCQGKCIKNKKPCDSVCCGKFVMKGIPQTTLDEHGVKKQLVDISLFERVYAGDKNVSVTFGTMKKNLFGNTYISVHQQSRKISPRGLYNLYT